MRKNKIFFNIFIFLILSICLSFLIYNFNVLKLKKSDRVIRNIDLSSVSFEGMNYNNYFTSTKSEKKKIKINYKGYIRKLSFIYKTKENMPVKISYNGKDYYNIKQKKVKSENFVKSLNKSTILIDDYVNGLIIDLSKGSNFSISKIQVNNAIQFNFYLFIFVFSVLLCFYSLYLYLKGICFNGKIENVFLVIVLLLGSLYIILEPFTTSNSWDDQIHFSNVLSVVEPDGKTDWTKSSSIMTEVNPFAVSIDTSEERVTQNNYLNKNDKKVINSVNHSRLIAYNQVGYIIPGLIFKLCSILGISFIFKIILTKFSILLFYSLIMYYAIKIIPHGKRILSVFGLFPSILFLATQFSYDSPLIAMICLFIAQYLNVMENKKSSVDLKQVLILLISIIFSSFIKAVYVPLILLLLFIPKEKFKNVRQKKYFKVGVLLIFVLIMSTFVLPTVTETNTIGDIRGGNTSVSGQLKMIVHHPFGYASVLNDSAVKYFTYKLIGDQTLYSYSYVGKNDFANLYNILLVTFLFVIITDSNIGKKCVELNKNIKRFNFVIILGIILLIWTALYLSFTPVAALDIFGVQNRYFIPLLIPIVLISLSNTKIVHFFDLKKYDFYILFTVVLVISFSLYCDFFIHFCN